MHIELLALPESPVMHMVVGLQHVQYLLCTRGRVLMLACLQCCRVLTLACLHYCRVLIFLEAEALGKPSPGFGVHVIPPLLEAAQKLGLRSLEVKPPDPFLNHFCNSTPLLRSPCIIWAGARFLPLALLKPLAVGNGYPA
jgi:hypothetical protein